MPTIEDRFYELHPKSAVLAEQARAHFPDGVTHDTRRFSPFPVFMDHGLGPRKWDIDGNEYIDFRTGHGAMILGQAHPAVVKAVSEQMTKGTHLSASTELELGWANLIKELMPSVEKLRFTSSGTEAVMMAFRMVRAHSGKTKIVKFQEAFHGWADGPYVGSDADVPDNGIPDEVRETMVVLPYDIAAVERAIEGDDVAAVIYQGDVPIQPSFLEQLRELTTQKGVILIFDEVVSGFRWSRSGNQGRFNITPDLSTMAKILAGGLPGGCVGGRADIIDMIGKGKIAHPGTFNANPLSAAAGKTALGIVASEPIGETADTLAQRLKDGLNDTLVKLEVPGCAYGVSSVIRMRLGVDHECDQEFCSEGGRAGAGYSGNVIPTLDQALLNEGVYGRATQWALSATHTEELVDQTVSAFERALMQVRSEAGI